MGQRELYLEKRYVYILFLYYGALVIGGGLVSVLVFVPGIFSYFDYMGLALIGSVAISWAGSGIYYFRKLYKIILQENLILKESCSDQKVVATLAYFLGRPIFSSMFAILVAIGFKSGVLVMGGRLNSIDYGYVQLSMFVSFFTGFLSGRFLRRLEVWGGSVINKITAEK